MLRVLILAVVLSLCVSCGGSAPRTVAPRAPTNAHAAWIAAVLGVPPELSVLVRPTAARADAYWGPLLSRVLAGRDRPGDFISHGSGAMVLNARQIEMHFANRDPFKTQRDSQGDPRSIAWVGIIHGIVPLDPQALRSGGGRPLFGPPFRMPSGVTMFPPDAGYAHEFGLFAPTLFITPDGTCIVTEGVSAPRARDFFAMNAAPPVPLEADPAALAGVTFGVTSVRFLNATKNDPSAIVQGMLVASLGLRGGAGGAIEGYADYASSDEASRAYTALQRMCADSEKCILPSGTFRNAQATRDDRRISMSFALSEAALRSIQSWQQ